MSYEYDLYLNEHIENVKRGLRWMSENLKLKEYAISIAMDNAMLHDESKTSSAEYRAYDDYFYGGNRSYSVVTKFNYAWLHHIHHNPHHWQYWVLINDDPEEGNVALEMPLPNVYEMIADWWTFSWKNNNLMEIFDWYDSHRKYMILHPRTRLEVENILGHIKEILEMQKTIGADYSKDEDWTTYVEHTDISDEDDKKYGVPEQKKFPMPDKDHVISAIRFFNYVDPKYEKELAEAILEKAEEYGVQFRKDISVGDENRFKKYLPEGDSDDATKES